MPWTGEHAGCHDSLTAESLRTTTPRAVPGDTVTVARVRRPLVIFALAAAVGLAWSFAVPLFSQPDERADVIRSYAAVRGELVGPGLTAQQRALWKTETQGLERPKASSVVRVRSSEALASSEYYRPCFARLPEMTPADCPQLSNSTHEVESWTWQGRSPPLVHLALGVVTFFRQDSAAVYVMRLVAALICAALIAMAAVALRKVGRFATIGLLIALTPMLLFLAGGATPSGVEVAAATAVWASLVLLLTSDDATDRALDRFGIASVLLILARPVGLLWFVLIMAICALWSGTPSRLMRFRRARAWAIGIGVVSLLAACWLVYAQTLSTNHNTNEGRHIALLHAAKATVDQTGMFMHQMLGAFDGDRAAFVPRITIGVWIACIGLLLFFLRRVRTREVLAFLAVIGCVVSIPVVLQSFSAAGAWNWWRGRYTLPLAVGLPIVIGATLARRGRNPSRLAAFGIPAALVVGHVAAFWIMLQRYTAGADASWWFFDEIRWHPPLFSSLVWISLYAVAVAALQFAIVSSRRSRQTPAAMTIASVTNPARSPMRTP